MYRSAPQMRRPHLNCSRAERPSETPRLTTALHRASPLATAVAVPAKRYLIISSGIGPRLDAWLLTRLFALTS